MRFRSWMAILIAFLCTISCNEEHSFFDPITMGLQPKGAYQFYGYLENRLCIRGWLLFTQRDAETVWGVWRLEKICDTNFPYGPEEPEAYLMQMAAFF